LNIDFDACSSIVRQGNGQYRLKPVLHAGEISLINNSISGRVVEIVDETTSNPIPNAVVLVEQRVPSTSLDRVLMQKTTGSDGRFIFCPLSSGPYDIVAAATNNSKTYNATVTLSVQPGTNMGDIPLEPEEGTPPTLPAGIDGQITSAPIAVDISISALQQAVGGEKPLFVTIPLFEGSAPNPTGSVVSCSTPNCTDYTLYVPASNPQVGTFSVDPPTSYTAPAPAPVNYWINAQASPDCTSPSTLLPIVVTPGGLTTQDLTFIGCGP